MKDLALQLVFRIIMTVLGLAITAIVGYIAKKHVKVKVLNTQIDVTNSIKSLINTYTPMAVHWAEQQTGWDGKDKNTGVVKMIEYLLKTMGGVQNPEKYEPIIKIAIEYYLNGMKMADNDTALTGMPEQAKIEKEDTVLSVDNDKPTEPVQVTLPSATTPVVYPKTTEPIIPKSGD